MKIECDSTIPCCDGGFPAVEQRGKYDIDGDNDLAQCSDGESLLAEAADSVNTRVCTYVCMHLYAILPAMPLPHLATRDQQSVGDGAERITERVRGPNAFLHTPTCYKIGIAD